MIVAGHLWGGLCVGSVQHSQRRCKRELSFQDVSIRLAGGRVHWFVESSREKGRWWVNSWRDGFMYHHFQVGINPIMHSLQIGSSCDNEAFVVHSQFNPQKPWLAQKVIVE